MRYPFTTFQLVSFWIRSFEVLALKKIWLPLKIGFVDDLLKLFDHWIWWNVRVWVFNYEIWRSATIIRSFCGPWLFFFGQTCFVDDLKSIVGSVADRLTLYILIFRVNAIWRLLFVLFILINEGFLKILNVIILIIIILAKMILGIQRP